mmetsp:Transcript_11511/g.31042  ORF Transcript_11511/g.31042 Transcript_11511/m.31042 type:complete len:266 (+) Transcript_11511:2452-3249(+)
MSSGGAVGSAPATRFTCTTRTYSGASGGPPTRSPCSTTKATSRCSSRDSATKRALSANGMGAAGASAGAPGSRRKPGDCVPASCTLIERHRTSWPVPADPPPRSQSDTLYTEPVMQYSTMPESVRPFSSCNNCALGAAGAKARTPADAGPCTPSCSAAASCSSSRSTSSSTAAAEGAALSLAPRTSPPKPPLPPSPPRSFTRSSPARTSSRVTLTLGGFLADAVALCASPSSESAACAACASSPPSSSPTASLRACAGSTKTVPK